MLHAVPETDRGACQRRDGFFQIQRLASQVRLLDVGQVHFLSPQGLQSLADRGPYLAPCLRAQRGEPVTPVTQRTQ